MKAAIISAGALPVSICISIISRSIIKCYCRTDMFKAYQMLLLCKYFS